MTLEPRSRSTRLIVVDQALSSMSNILLTISAARAAGATEFGGFAWVLAAYATALLLGRALIGQPLMIRGQVARVPGTGAAALAVGVISAMPLLAFGLQLEVHSSIVLAMCGSLPALLLQDAGRFAAFVSGAEARAVRSDFIWLSAALVALAASRDRSLRVVFLIWVAGGCLALLPLLGTWMRVAGFWRLHSFWLTTRGLSGSLLLEAVATLLTLNLTLACMQAVAGGAGAGALRGAQTLFSPLNTLVALSFALLAPVLRVRIQGGVATHKLFISLSSSCLAVLASYCGALLLLPDGVGRVALGDSWGSSRSLILPVALAAGASALSTLPATEIKVREHMRSLVVATLVTAGVQACLLLVAWLLADSAQQVAYASALGWVMGLMIWLRFNWLSRKSAT